jgi:hypothetical protein
MDSQLLILLVGAHEQGLLYKITEYRFFHKDFGCEFGRRFGLMLAAGNTARIKSTIPSLSDRCRAPWQRGRSR